MNNQNFFPNKFALITLIIGCFVVFVSMGIRQTYGLFFQFFESDLSITSTSFGLSIGIQAIVWGTFATIFGLIADKFGANKVVSFALIIYATGIFFISNFESSGLFFQINLGLLVGIGLGGAAAPIVVPTVAKHFPNHDRAKVAGIVTAFASVGMFVYPLISNTLFKITTWNYVFNIFTLVMIFAALLALLLKKPNEENEPDVVKNQNFIEALNEAFSHKGYLFLMAGFFVCGFQITLIATHIPGYMQERGMGGWSATIILALIGLFNIIGTLGMGYLGTKYRKKSLLCILYALRAVSIAIFIFSPPSNIMSIVFGISFGLLWLSTVPPTNGIVAQIFGTKYLSSLFGIVFLSHQVGAFIGAYLGGYFYDQFGSYDYAFYMAIALSIFATIVHYPINERPIQRFEATI